MDIHSIGKTKRNLTKIFLLISSVLLLVFPTFAANWPNFRGDVSNSGASSENLNLPLVEQWHSSAPDVEENGVVIANGIAYMATEDGHLYAFDVATGFNVAGFPITVPSSYSTPAVDPANDRIYLLAASTIYAFRLNGTPAWTLPVGSTGYNFSQGPIVEDSFVYLHTGALLRKFDANGILQWSSVAPGNNTQPAIMGEFVYVNTEVGRIQKHDKATGALVLSIATGSQQASLTAVNGKIFFKGNVLYAYNADTGALIWSQPAGGNSSLSQSPAVSGGVVYVYGWDGKLYAFDENTGATMTGFPTVLLGTASSDRNWSSPAVAGDKVFVAAGTTQRLKVVGAAGTAQAGQVLEDHLTFSTDTQGFDLCSPAISDCYVFAMLDGGGLYAFYAGCGELPTGSLAINSGSDCTDSQMVILTLGNNNNSNVTDMRISEDPFFAGVPWVAYAETSTFTLSAGFGSKTVYAQLRDNGGVLSNVFTDSIEFQESCGAAICGDLDHDGDVDITDREILRAALRICNGGAGFVAEADYDGDGCITFNDYREWYKCYTLYVAAD